MEAAFKAIADPARRTILDLLADRERSVSQLLTHFDFSQPALSKHLRVLLDAGLVKVRPERQRRLYALRAEGLRSVSEWVRHYEHFWNEKLDALGTVLNEQASKEGKA